MRRADGGLTLIEILIALVVMVLGVVGILALFPPALESAKISMEETQAAIVGESVANAIAAASRFSVLELAGPGGRPHYRMTLTHDSINSAMGAGDPKALVYYQFFLPEFSDGQLPAPNNNSGSAWYHHPVGAQPGVGTPVPIPVPSGWLENSAADWRLVGDPWTKAQYEMIKGGPSSPGTDASDPLSQFVYSFDVRKINTLEYLIGQPKPGGGNFALADLDTLVRVWEFRIHLFRAQVAGASFGSGTQAGGGPGGSSTGATPKKHIATMTTRVTVR